MSARQPIDPAWWNADDIDGVAMRKALAERDIQAIFNFLHRRGWSWAAIAQATDIGEQRVREIAGGKRRIENYDVYVRVAVGLNIPRDYLGVGLREVGQRDAVAGSSSSAADVPAARTATLRHTLTVDTSASARRSYHEHEDTDVHRRRLLQDIAIAGLATPLLGVEQLRHDLLAAAHGQSYDHAEWEAIAWDYGCLYATMPPRALLADLTQDLLVANTQMRRLNDEADRRDLSRVMAQLGVFLAQTMGNLGDIHAGRRWWRFARRMADTSTDPQVRVWVRGRDIIRSLYEHQPLQQVIDLADEAASISRNPGMGTGSALIGRAQALAVLGRNDEARTAMNAVYTVLDRLPAQVTSDTASMYGWPEYRLRHGESFVYTYLGDAERAETAQRQALTLYAPDMFRERAQVQLHEALRLVRTDPQHGVNHAVQTLSGLPGSQRIEAVLEVARSVVRAVPATEQQHSNVHELQEILSAPAQLITG
ncbi:hypothetical protein ABT369_03460 [Dactylosporangium sp. NPDC000244]|uniref:hypothetical protein n=1 Tax=Dactylosporangium sp. NPDC000244 TaxID=3154365 RepID=UPI00332F063A